MATMDIPQILHDLSEMYGGEFIWRNIPKKPEEPTEIKNLVRKYNLSPKQTLKILDICSKGHEMM